MGTPVKVLLADDEPVLRAALAKTLVRAGYAVASAADGEEAVAVFERNRDVRVAILDVAMPRQTGIQAHDRIRELDPSVRTLFITGFVKETEDLTRRASAGRVEVLIKPFTVQALLERVAALLAARASDDERSGS